MSNWLAKYILGAVAGLSIACGGASPAPSASEAGSPEQLGVSNQRVLASCPHTTPVINMDKELVIRALSVVNDPCRTKFGGSGTAACTTNIRGHWSFGYIMSQLAGNKGPEETSAFVLNWLGRWEQDQSVNGFLLPKRLGMTSFVVSTWRLKSGCLLTGPCTLDFNQAPFRLLAIVNRIDLSGPIDFYTQSSSSPGEMRIVFGFLDLNKLSDSSSGQGKLNATAIFEYKLSSTKTTFNWAKAWHDLGALELNSEQYNQALQAITDTMVTYNTAVNPGGTAISQVRTNEASFDLGSVKQWELREQKLVCSAGTCNLVPDTVKLTPDNSFNETAALDAFLLSNQAKILKEDFSGLNPSWLSGASRSEPTNKSPLIWDLTSGAANPNYEPSGGSFKPLARHLFGLSTCNGCHYAETNTSNFHIAPRSANLPSAPSGFVGGSNALESVPDAPGQPANFITPTDPSHVDITHEYNDAWRRKCEMQRLIKNISTPLFRPSGAH